MKSVCDFLPLFVVEMRDNAFNDRKQFIIFLLEFSDEVVLLTTNDVPQNGRGKNN